jgi:hypothetical protein
VNTAINDGKFLGSCVTGGFSIRADIRGVRLLLSEFTDWANKLYLICFILVRHTNNIKKITQFCPV